MNIIKTVMVYYAKDEAHFPIITEARKIREADTSDRFDTTSRYVPKPIKHIVFNGRNWESITEEKFNESVKALKIHLK